MRLCLLHGPPLTFLGTFAIAIANGGLSSLHVCTFICSASELQGYEDRMLTRTGKHCTVTVHPYRTYHIVAFRKYRRIQKERSCDQEQPAAFSVASSAMHWVSGLTSRVTRMLTWDHTAETVALLLPSLWPVLTAHIHSSHHSLLCPDPPVHSVETLLS